MTFSTLPGLPIELFMRLRTEIDVQNSTSALEEAWFFSLSEMIKEEIDFCGFFDLHLSRRRENSSFSSSYSEEAF